MQQPATTRFPVLRSVLHEGFDRFDDDQFEQQLGYYWPDTSADELEINFGNIGRSLSRGLGQAGSVLSKAAPGALSGAVQGAQMGAALGPYGMLAGAALGAVGGGYMSYRSSQQRPPAQPQARPQAQPQAGARPAPIPQPARAPYTPPRAGPVPQSPIGPGAPAVPGSPASPPLVPQQPGAIPAANGGQALLQVLARPEVINALLSLAAGRLGRQQIPVGSRTASPSQVVALAGMTPPTGLPVNTETEVWSDPYEQETLLHEMEQYAAETHPFFAAIEREPDAFAPPDYFDDGSEPEYFPETFDDWPEEEFAS